ncbi:hypothetical protein PC128_g10664 [Phytophthora cactorum]|nr:hypothetical protein PC120_g8681 [Phytophthora cactorum]KAG3075725.1 hypothetical protein PC121_g7933 [Phytophthora cactorum]KAG3192146.1 hypothetical protein PC128_g10664 [Phytophthora cactorum]KAG4056258.1 hypothetical protein PC123_g8694 [Phytophthora cactorum]
MAVRASIPICVLWADRIGQLIDARTVAEAIINDRKFPPWLLQMKLEHQQVSVPLEEFRIKHVELSRENKKLTL